MVEIKTDLPVYEKAIKAEKKKGTGMTVREADHLRNDDIQAFFSSIKVYKASRNTLKKEAYERLNVLFNSYKGIKVANYEKKTAMLKNLFAKLEQETYKQDLTTLNCVEFFETLKESQAAFYERYLDVTNTNSKASTQVAASTLREAIEENYQSLYTYIWTVYRLEKSNTMATALILLNEIRQDYANKLKLRKADKEQKKAVAETATAD